MVLTFFSGFEMGTAGEWVGLIGTASISVAQKKTGTYSLRCNPSAATGYVYNGTTCREASFYIYIVDAPDSDTCIFGRGTVGTGCGLWLTTARQIDYYEGTNKRVDGTTVLDLNTWYRISVTVNSDDAWGYYWINGSAEGNYDGLDAYFYQRLGIVGTCTADVYFDDFACAFDASQTTDIGDIRVATAANPNANGDVNNFDGDTDGGADHYTFYDDPAGSLDDNDYVIHEAKTVVQDIANLDSCADIGLVGTDIIDAVRICYRWKLSKDGDDLPSVYVKDDGTGYATVVPRDSDNVWYWDFKLYATNAPRGTAWTQAIFNAFQAGMQSSGDAADVYLSCILVMVAYHAGAVAARRIFVTHV